MNISLLDPEVSAYRAAQRAENDARREIDRLQAACDATPEWQALALAREQFAAVRSATEATRAGLEAIAVIAARTLHDMEPHPDVKVVRYATFKYDEMAAIEWAADVHPQALSLNKREFERAARALKVLPFVEYGEELRVRIRQKDVENGGGDESIPEPSSGDVGTV